MSAPVLPVAVLSDTIAAAGVLFAARFALIVLLRRRPAAMRWAPDWVRRIAVVTMLLPAARLFALAPWRPAQAAQLVAFGLAILAAGGVLLAIDGVLAERLRKRLRGA